MKRNSFRFARVVALLAMCAFGLPAWATNYPVGCGASAANDLYNAINSAGSSIGGATVTLTAGCTYTMTWSGPTATDGSPTIFKPVANPTTVYGNGATIALAAASAPARFFYVASSGALTLQNLTLEGGIAQGAPGLNAAWTGSQSIQGAGGNYSALGGAILNDGNLNVTAVTFANNKAIGGNGGRGISLGTSGGGGGGGLGGAIFSRGSMMVAASTFNGNSAIGGLPADSQNCFANNASCPNAGGGGGGAGGNGGAPNQAGNAGQYGGGGGGAGWGGGKSAGAGGFAGGGGGANWTATGLGGEFGGDSAIYGFSGGGGGGLGGAIFIESVSGSAQIINCTFGDNSANGGNSISGNGGSGAGGAVFVHGGALSMLASTLSVNSASGGSVTQAANAQNGGNAQGGNIYVHSGATLNLVQTIVTGGTVTAGASNNGSAGSASDPDVFGALASNGYNLVTTRGDSSGYVSTDLADGTAANLGALASNGGPTQTMLPQVGSAAIDAVPSTGCNVAVDQRNAPRPIGSGCDIGSVEINDIIFRNGFESSALPMVECGGTTGYSNYFGDDFTESSLDARWSYINANGGAIAVGSGSASLSSTAAQFPFVAANSAIPASGDFSVRWQATYTNASGNGDGTLVISRGVPTNGQPDNYNLRAADAWQDSNNGFQVRARTSDAGSYGPLLTGLPPALTQHDVEYCWLGNANTVQIWVDGVLQSQFASSGLTRPNAIWFGNPVNRGASGTPWNAFTLYSVHVRSLTP